MQINKNRKGLALGAVFALFASLFVGAAPASANTSGQYIAMTPEAGSSTNFNGTTLEDFPMVAYLLPGVSNDEFASNNVIWSVRKVSGNMEVLINTESAITDAASPDTVWGVTPGQDSDTISAAIEASSSTAVTVSGLVMANGASTLSVRAYTASGIVSSSPSVTLEITVWLENPATTNGLRDDLEWFTTRTVVLHSLNSIPAVTTITAPEVGDTVVTVSAVVSALNFNNLEGKFWLQVNSTATNFANGTDAAATKSAAAPSGVTMTALGGIVSQSFSVTQSAGIAAATSISAHVRYASTIAAAVDAGYRLGALASGVAAGTATEDLSLDVVPGANATQSGQTATVRPNQTYTFKVGAESDSNQVSVSGAVINVAITGPDLSVNVKEISINGAAATTSYPTALALTTNALGYATFTLATTGFVDTNDLTIVATEGNVSKSLTVDVTPTNPALTADYSLLSSGAGETTAVTFSVKDQWGQLSTATNLRVKITKGGVAGFSYTDTVSYVAVTAGKATFNFTPTPAAKTGSATVTALLQEMQASTGAYDTEAGSTNVVVTVNVSAAANAFSTGLLSSYSASVSYPTTYAAAVTMGGKATNTGSAVVVSGAGLIFEDASGDTASDTITVRVDGSLAYSVNVYGMMEGSHVVTFTNGSATTTSLLVVSAAASDMGRSIVWDTTTVAAGRTAIVTGTLLDDNGNPVSTTLPGSTAGDSGTASIVVTFAGTAGIPVGAMPTETDADGKFQVSLLTAAADRGTFTLTATYAPQGASTAVRNLITGVNTITVGTASATPASDQKLTVGSFKGFVAIYALNYTGQKLSAKVAGKWLTVNELSRFQRVVRNTGAGYTIKVDLYIDGAFVRSETVVTK